MLNVLRIKLDERFEATYGGDVVAAEACIINKFLPFLSLSFFSIQHSEHHQVIVELQLCQFTTITCFIYCYVYDYHFPFPFPWNGFFAVLQYLHCELVVPIMQNPLQNNWNFIQQFKLYSHATNFITFVKKNI